jgi:murein DD-endopeptidase MepM/ murein hydrolase activator NlpD
MKYTVRLAHLEHRSHLVFGQKVTRGTVIGTQGSSGQSTGDHLHLDVVIGEHTENWRLHEVDPDGRDTFMVWPSAKQALLFIDKELCDGNFYEITTYYADPRYWVRFKNPDGTGKIHCGYDIVAPKGTTFRWNRSVDGHVTFSGWDNGYGWTVLISFEA